MHYYKFNIADYRKDTSHLSTIEHGIYRQLIDWYYLDEKPIPLETQVVSRRLRLGSEMEISSLKNVLSDFFKEGKTGYIHKRIEVEIKDYHEQAEKNKNNGKLGGRPKKTQSVISGLPDESQNNPNHKPITNNHKPIDKENKRGSRLSQDFIFPKEWCDFLIEQRPELNAQQTFDNFKDYWIASPKGTKLDWFATWRNWVRNTSAPKPNPADIARVTVPPSKKADEALIKILEDEKKAAPIPDSVREYFAKNRRQA